MSEKNKLKLFERINALEEQVKALTWELARLRFNEIHGSDGERPKFMDAKEIKFEARFYNEPWPHVRFEEIDSSDDS